MPRFLLTLPSSTDDTSSSSPSNDVSPSILITVLILAVAVILFASLYLFLRFLRRKTHRTSASSSSAAVVNPSNTPSSPPYIRQVSPVIDSLPLFTYDRLTAKNGGDCAVCLSKFERNDVLRLLPVCCHAFHAECIDTWLSANLTCPLCRSPIFLSESDILRKLPDRSGSFRVELGSVLETSTVSTVSTNSGEIRRSYSLGGSFDYVIAGDEDAVADVTPTSAFYKPAIATSAEEQQQQQQQEVLASEVGTRGGVGAWLKDYLSNSLTSSRTASFRSSGRFFTGSSRRSAVELPAGNRESELAQFDEASRLGDEIGELFRWLSGVVPQSDRVLIRLEDLPEKSAGGVLLPKSAVKFERYLMGEILSVGSEVGEVEAGKKVLFSDISAYEVDLGSDSRHCFCKEADLLAVVE
ncbi:hypothetical protein KSS87_010626 [Heliosperma pusillum]|nr:hypothetical protein KSS87_010626 [Heliosperma pusillum]